MRSVLLCEGSDDRWFSAYYLNKSAEWDDCREVKKYWPYYEIKPLNNKQQVWYYCKGNDSVAIWSVGGKDAFSHAIEMIFSKIVSNYPQNVIDSIVILRDRDTDQEEDILATFEDALPKKLSLSNHSTSIYSDVIDDIQVNIRITPVIIPFDDCGAIESLLLEAIREANSEGALIADGACRYIDGLVENPNIGQIYLKHDREVVKAKYAAAIAATNPGHSTGLFQDMVFSCPWEDSECVKRHFDLVLNAVTGS